MIIGTIYAWLSITRKSNILLKNLKSYGSWLENATQFYSNGSWDTYAYKRIITTDDVGNSNNIGVHPAIEVAKTNIEY